MKRELKYILLSLAAGVLILAGLFFFCFSAITPDGESPVQIVAMFVAAFITIPILLFCGADCRAPVWLLLVTALFDVLCLSAATYLVLLLGRTLRRKIRKV